jgi:hypothetical protein
VSPTIPNAAGANGASLPPFPQFGLVESGPGTGGSFLLELQLEMMFQVGAAFEGVAREPAPAAQPEALGGSPSMPAAVPGWEAVPLSDPAFHCADCAEALSDGVGRRSMSAPEPDAEFPSPELSGMAVPNPDLQDVEGLALDTAQDTGRESVSPGGSEGASIRPARRIGRKVSDAVPATVPPVLQEASAPVADSWPSIESRPPIDHPSPPQGQPSPATFADPGPGDPGGRDLPFALRAAPPAHWTAVRMEFVDRREPADPPPGTVVQGGPEPGGDRPGLVWADVPGAAPALVEAREGARRQAEAGSDTRTAAFLAAQGGSGEGTATAPGSGFGGFGDPPGREPDQGGGRAPEAEPAARDQPLRPRTVGSLSVRLDGASSEVDLRVRAAGPSLELAVASPSAELARSIHAGLPQLEARMGAQGFHLVSAGRSDTLGQEHRDADRGGGEQQRQSQQHHQQRHRGNRSGRERHGN